LIWKAAGQLRRVGKRAVVPQPGYSPGIAVLGNMGTGSAPRVLSACYELKDEIIRTV